MAQGDSQSASQTALQAQAIRAELARRRMSRASLAHGAKISLSALEKGLAGSRPFSDAALLRIGDVLGLSFRAADGRGAACDELGGYGRASVSWLEGNYLTIRPSSKRPQDLFTYVTDVTWDEARSQLVFKELARLDKDFAQFGSVAVPHQTGHIYFATNRHGQQRLMIMKREVRGGGLFGLLLTLQQEKGAHLSPVAMPIVMLPVALLADTPAMGVISPAHKRYADYISMLRKVASEGFAAMLPVPVV